MFRKTRFWFETELSPSSEINRFHMGEGGTETKASAGIWTHHSDQISSTAVAFLLQSKHLSP